MEFQQSLKRIQEQTASKQQKQQVANAAENQVPAHGGAVPAYGGARPAGAGPAYGDAGPAHGGAVPADGGALPADGGAGGASTTYGGAGAAMQANAGDEVLLMYTTPQGKKLHSTRACSKSGMHANMRGLKAWEFCAHCADSFRVHGLQKRKHE